MRQKTPSPIRLESCYVRSSNLPSLTTCLTAWTSSTRRRARAERRGGGRSLARSPSKPPDAGIPHRKNAAARSNASSSIQLAKSEPLDYKESLVPGAIKGAAEASRVSSKIRSIRTCYSLPCGVGATLQGAVRVALAPVTALVWGYDKIKDFLSRSRQTTCEPTPGAYPSRRVQWWRAPRSRLSIRRS